jgi:single-strand DNA-binding protein
MAKASEDAADGPVNQVVLRGRVSSPPVAKELPSGARIVTFRISVTREKTAMTAGSRQPADWVDCVAWARNVQRSASTFDVGDVVEVEGALRRRFFRAQTSPTTRVEVEVLKGRRIARAA